MERDGRRWNEMERDGSRWNELEGDVSRCNEMEGDEMRRIRWYQIWDEIGGYGMACCL